METFYGWRGNISSAPGQRHQILLMQRDLSATELFFCGGKTFFVRVLLKFLVSRVCLSSRQNCDCPFRTVFFCQKCVFFFFARNKTKCNRVKILLQTGDVSGSQVWHFALQAMGLFESKLYYQTASARRLLQNVTSTQGANKCWYQASKRCMVGFWSLWRGNL